MFPGKENVTTVVDFFYSLIAIKEGKMRKCEEVFDCVCFDIVLLKKNQLMTYLYLLRLRKKIK